MKKLLFISMSALLLSACSTSNQISITQSRYGNGVGVSFGSDGMSKAEQAKAEHFKEVVSERIQQRKFLKAVSLEKRAPQSISNDFESPSLLETTQKESNLSSNISDNNINKKEGIINESSTNTTSVRSLGEKPVGISKKSGRKNLNAFRRQSNNEESSSDGIALLLLVIIALFIPPLAVFLYEGEINSRFWISLILTILFFIPGVIYALILILGGY